MNQSAVLRQEFLSFFKKLNHRITPSSPLIPQGDKSLMFTSAGMVPFKPYFLGLASGLSRAASCQKCFRTTDITNVGLTVRHLTFFEMLGNFSFGDYFKEDAIKWAWEFLTQKAGFDSHRLYPTIFKDDLEAEKIWKSLAVPNSPVRLGEDTNFWTMGPTGPCGPCSEIYFDRGPQFSCGKPSCSVGCDCDRYLEVWNLVFTQFDRQEDQSLIPLPRKNIDTGMGLERLVFSSQDKLSPFDTDLFLPIIEKASALFNRDFRQSSLTETSFRVIADHLRGSVFLLSEGIIPSNIERGYVLRRLIRRAARYGKMLGAQDPFLHELVGSCLSIYSGVYPEIEKSRDLIQMTLKSEEEKFLETLAVGEAELAGLLSRQSGKTLNGREAFRLYETFGFPLELTREICAEKGFQVDEVEFNNAFEKSVEIARSSWKGSGENRIEIPHFDHPTQFLGYEEIECTTRIANADFRGKRGFVVLEQTPFYPEGGGQVGDQGEILSEQGEILGRVIDTQKQGATIIHVLESEEIRPFQKDRTVIARVDKKRRALTSPHHTATHLLNAALRTVLGSHVRQAGSYVGPDKLRFDFTHPSALGREQIEKIESLVNDEIKKSDPVIPRENSIDKVKELGAVTLVGENYGDKPRFLLIGPKGWDNPQDRFSLELCGGTHVSNTSEIKTFKIIKESSAASGVRRIEAVAGDAAKIWKKEKEKEEGTLLKDLKSRQEKLLEEIISLGGKTPSNISFNQDVHALRVQEKELDKILNDLKTKKMYSDADAGNKVVLVKGISVHLQKLNGAEPKMLREIADMAKTQAKAGIIFIACPANGKLSFVLSLNSDVIARGLDASKIAKSLASSLSGSAGGRPDFAQGGVSEKDWEEVTRVLISLL